VAKPKIERRARTARKPKALDFGERTVAFNRYMVVYSNNFDGNLSSAWRAGSTLISCYQNTTFVGTITFYSTGERMNGGYVDANGVVVVEYPISSFTDVLHLLQTSTSLNLLFVERDLNGNPLSHRVGAVMVNTKPVGS
jgi:hypothetical protein